VHKWLKTSGMPPRPLPQLLADKALATRLRGEVHSQIANASKAAKLAGFEIVRRLHLDSKTWTPENGLLTPTFKLKRNDAKKRFQADIDAMYAAGPEALPSKL